LLQNTVQPEEFERLINDYQQSYLVDGEEIVFSMDSKTLKGTIPRGELRGTHLLSIYVAEQGLVLVQAEVDRKENEIVVAPKILKQVNLSEAIVVGDAMHTPRRSQLKLSKQVEIMFGQSEAISPVQNGLLKSSSYMKSVISRRVHLYRNIARGSRKFKRGMDALRHVLSW
jgi:predicted transposase YbfD/YdcC